MGILPPPFSHRLPVVTAPISCPRGTARSSALHIPQFPPLCFFNHPSRSAECIFVLCAGEARYLFFGIQRAEAAQLQVSSGICRGRKLGTKTKCFLLFTNQEQTTVVIRGKQQKLHNNNNNTTLILISPSHTSIFSPSVYFSFTVLLHLPPSPRLRLQISSRPPPPSTLLRLFWFSFFFTF